MEHGPLGVAPVYEAGNTSSPMKQPDLGQVVKNPAPNLGSDSEDDDATPNEQKRSRPRELWASSYARLRRLGGMCDTPHTYVCGAAYIGAEAQWLRDLPNHRILSALGMFRRPHSTAYCTRSTTAADEAGLALTHS